MFRSPPQLRSGFKGYPVLSSGGADKKKFVLSLFTSSDLVCSKTTMALTGTDKAAEVDATVIADLVGKHLFRGDSCFGRSNVESVISWDSNSWGSTNTNSRDKSLLECIISRIPEIADVAMLLDIARGRVGR
ncbi:hypothetical protein J6590_073744 [Homalodisca vitripennis]|nr:hypothetical protein J6590_073744 [Homalodisca vitripennis]